MGLGPPPHHLCAGKDGDPGPAHRTAGSVRAARAPKTFIQPWTDLYCGPTGHPVVLDPGDTGGNLDKVPVCREGQGGASNTKKKHLLVWCRCLVL